MKKLKYRRITHDLMTNEVDEYLDNVTNGEWKIINYNERILDEKRIRLILVLEEIKKAEIL